MVEMGVLNWGGITVVAGSVRASNYQGYFGNLGARYSRYKFGAIFCNSTSFRLTPHHKTCRKVSLQGTKFKKVIYQ